jgi:DNA-binding transcriptional LysR family regulator
MFDLGHARSFVTVAEEMHLGRAAARLNLSQSPLSRRIQALDQALCATLLERTTHAARLTPVGRTFLAKAYRVLATAEKATQVTRRAAQGRERARAARLHRGLTLSCSVTACVACSCDRAGH